MNKIIKSGIGVIVWMTISFGLKAQTDSLSITAEPSSKGKGEIVLTQSELINFLEKIAKARKEIVEQDMEDENTLLLNRLSSGYGLPLNNSLSVPLSSNKPIYNMSRDELLREIEALHSRLNYMYGYGGGGATTFIIPHGDMYREGYPYYDAGGGYNWGGAPNIATPFAAAGSGDMRWRIDSLQNEVAKLTASDAVANSNEIARLNREIDLVQDSLLATSSLTPEAKEVVKKYGTQMQVFFENDASDVSSQYDSEVENVARVLRRNPQLGIVLKGYASAVGSTKYNYDLSMRRNEAVKRMLIDYGVFPDQISSVFYGIDKSTTSASEARRVDMKFIIQ